MKRASGRLTRTRVSPQYRIDSKQEVISTRKNSERSVDGKSKVDGLIGISEKIHLRK
jgi:hypothetical protein